ncbi:MAG: hypothetical protein KA015_06715 [Spirochaetes bacterium]|nr:hypothetical protein [Spirochaetota bacterium]
MKYILATAAVIIILNACTSFHKTGVASEPLAGKTISENLGQTEGSDLTFRFLWYMIGMPDFDFAMKRAKDNKKADAVINAEVKETRYSFILFSIDSINVKGEAVKFAQSEQKDKTKGKK